MPKQTFSNEFKTKIVKMVLDGANRQEICQKYNIGHSTLSRWISQYRKHQSFDPNAGLSDAELEIIYLKKELEEANMEIDILKQAALIMGRK